LDAVLNPRGFHFKPGYAQSWHGKDSASGEYAKGDRRIEVHFRYSLGLITYHLGKLSLSHEEYMRGLLGSGGGNRYPGFSDDPLQAFHDLAHDLEHFCADFLSGAGVAFRRCHSLAEQRKKLPGFQKLPG
jgi:hypothetical protein